MDSPEKYCAHHKPINLGYIQWHTMADKRVNQRYRQVYCPNCEHYLFPDELNEPDNPKAHKSIERHKAYLEKHPKAKSVVL